MVTPLDVSLGAAPSGAAPRARKAQRGKRGRSRGRGKPGTRCGREGCNRRQSEGYLHCSLACKIVDAELTYAQTRCTEQAVADPEGTTRLWLAAVALNDALTELYQARRAVTRTMQRCE